MQHKSGTALFGVTMLAKKSLELLSTHFHPGFLASLFDHPVYDDELMRHALRHAIYSAIANSTETATSMFLPCCGGRMSTNPYFQTSQRLPPFTLHSRDYLLIQA